MTTAKKNNGVPEIPSWAKSGKELDEKIAKFEHPGDFVAGLLVDIEVRSLMDTRTGQPKEVLHYILEAKDCPGVEDGETVVFRETTDIKRKLTHEHKGYYVCVQRTGDEIASNTRGNNPMKVHRVILGAKGDPTKIVGSGVLKYAAL